MTTLMTAYFATTGLMMLCMGAIWTRKGWFNLILKLAFFLLAAWSALFLFRDIIEALPNA